MLSSIIKWSIARRWLVILGALLVPLWTVHMASQMPVVVFRPSFAPPQVEIQTEAPELAPEEVESLVTLAIKSAIYGTPTPTAKIRTTNLTLTSLVEVLLRSLASLSLSVP